MGKLRHTAYATSELTEEIHSREREGWDLILPAPIIGVWEGERQGEREGEGERSDARLEGTNVMGLSKSV